jgi:hypothetical protein
LRARSAVVVVLILVTLAVAVTPGASAGTGSSTPTPTIEGPVTGGKGTPQLAATNFDLASVGYEQAEYFISGTATAYTSATPLSSDGKWSVTPGTTAPYKTRLVVYRPTDPKKFNGTVIVEWNNVSAGLDSAPIWLAAHDELIREGYAWVGVTAQRVGVEGGGRSLVANLDLKHADPDRYGTLVHPGDSFSYDMYTQAGRAVRSTTSHVLGGLVAKHVIAAGESQSAFRMTTYIDAVEPLTKGVYDGYFVYSRGNDGAALAQDPQPAVAAPSPTLIRTDLEVPVMTFTTETDLITLGYLAARQPDTKKFRNWEVAGTSHADTYTLSVAGKDVGTPASDADLFQTMLQPPSTLYGGIISCDRPINAGPMTYVLRSSIDALNSWIVDGTVPPKAPRLQTTGDTATPFALDANGNVKGGIRTAEVDVPVATLSGLGQSGTGFCRIFGTTTPFDAAKLASLYPSHGAFVKAWNAATDKAVHAGFVVAADAPGIKAAAAHSPVGQ